MLTRSVLWRANPKRSAAYRCCFTSWPPPAVDRAPFRLRTYTPFLRQVDVYSFGVVLWELWERRRPFEDLRNRFDIADTVAAGGRPPIGRGCPPSYADLVRRCWHQVGQSSGRACPEEAERASRVVLRAASVSPHRARRCSFFAHVGLCGVDWQRTNDHELMCVLLWIFALVRFLDMIFWQYGVFYKHTRTLAHDKRGYWHTTYTHTHTHGALLARFIDTKRFGCAVLIHIFSTAPKWTCSRPCRVSLSLVAFCAFPTRSSPSFPSVACFAFSRASSAPPARCHPSSVYPSYYV